MSIFDGALELSVTSASGVEAVTKRELISLGYEPGGAEYGRISFSGNFTDVARANIFLRTANRVFINLNRFVAKSFDELFDGVKAMPWNEIIGADGVPIINAKSIKSTLYALSAIQSVTKKAIAVAMGGRLKDVGTEYKIEVVIISDEVLIALDTSGTALHKRGYRTKVGEAPLRETLAAAIVLLSVWNAERPLLDPFTGSGTIPIESALIATDTAPGLKREFAFEAYKNAPYVMDKVRAEAEEKIKRDLKLRVSGFDINPDAIKLAQYHARNAGVDGNIHFQASDMRTLSSRYAHGVIITNPPYGERLMPGNELTELYRDFGKLYSGLDEWSAYVITSYGAFERYFGKRADKKRKLYNSELECTLYRFLGAKPQK